MRLFVLLSLSALLSCAHHEERRQLAGSGGGVTLVGRLNDLVLAGDSGAAHPGQGLSRAEADRRYLRLAGGTTTGDLVVRDEVCVTRDGVTRQGCISAAPDSNWIYLTTRGWRIQVPTGNNALWIDSGGIWMRNAAAGFSIGTSGSEYFGLSAGDSVVRLENNATLRFGTGARLRMDGVATGSLPTCNSTNAGTLQWDTTRTRFVQCGEDATATYEWTPLKTFSTVSGTNASNSNAAARDVAYTFVRYPATGDILRFIVQVAGSGAGDVTLSVTDSSGTVCSGTHACAGAAGGTTSIACDQPIAAGDLFLRVDGTACAATGVPIGTLALSYR